jgi:hypothetical protein
MMAAGEYTPRRRAAGRCGTGRGMNQGRSAPGIWLPGPTYRAGGRPVSRTCSTHVMEVLPPAWRCYSTWCERGAAARLPPAAGLLLRGRCDSVTRQEEARRLLARLGELARDETLSDEDATEMVAGLVGALERMRENPAWQRVMAKAGPRLSRWPRWVTARNSPPHDPDTPRPEMPLTHGPAEQHRRLKRPEPHWPRPRVSGAKVAWGRAGSPAGHMAVFCNAARGCRSVRYRPRHKQGT